MGGPQHSHFWSALLIMAGSEPISPDSDNCQKRLDAAHQSVIPPAHVTRLRPKNCPMVHFLSSPGSRNEIEILISFLDADIGGNNIVDL